MMKGVYQVGLAEGSESGPWREQHVKRDRGVKVYGVLGEQQVACSGCWCMEGNETVIRLQRQMMKGIVGMQCHEVV